MKHTISMYITRGQMCEAMQAEIDKLEAEIEELRKDRERLDWLLDNRASVSPNLVTGVMTCWDIYDDIRGKGQTQREAIDNAMIAMIFA